MSRIVHRHHHGFYGYGRCGGWGGHHGRWGGWHRGGYGMMQGYGEGGGGPWGDEDGGGFEAGPGWGGPRWRGNPFRDGFIARAISDRLEATPAQEKVIRDATDEFREAASKLRGEGKKTRADVAAAFRKSAFDEVLLGELYARHDRSIEDLRKAFVGMGARIHDALDEKQRARLADLIEAGPGAWAPWSRRRHWH
ncbi:MAG TPA: periplasmic heavy metal sensor [Polyangia bacterium]|nr:periplasmic heavy metal sensor [Polyangia bacterium]